jgi:hypothetical protein
MTATIRHHGGSYRISSVTAGAWDDPKKRLPPTHTVHNKRNINLPKIPWKRIMEILKK